MLHSFSAYTSMFNYAPNVRLQNRGIVIFHSNRYYHHNDKTCYPYCVNNRCSKYESFKGYRSNDRYKLLIFHNSMAFSKIKFLEMRISV